MTSLLQTRPSCVSSAFNLIGLIDDTISPLLPEHESLFHEVSTCWNPCLAEASLFLNGSPMTHSITLSRRFLSHRNVLSVAVVYDFIPLDWPGYLDRTSSRIEYFSRLAALKRNDLFTPISEYAATRLRELVDAPQQAIRVIGAPVRRSLIEAANQLSRESVGLSRQPYFFTLGGGDRRKNTETAAAAVRNTRLILGQEIRLKIVGELDPAYKATLQEIAGGDCIDFLNRVSDAELAQLYAGAIATIVPSHIEGFSLPVVEAAICGSAVVASSCSAHVELISDPEALFVSTDVEDLTDKLVRLCQDRTLRDRLIRQQEAIRHRFSEECVSGRFWSFALEEFERRFPSSRPARAFSIGGSLPRIALLSPYPPDESGVARFTERTLKAATGKIRVDLFTDAERPLALHPGSRDAGPYSLRPLASDYDAVVSVVGNSHFHNYAFDFLGRHGGPCILHDSRLTQIMRVRLGEEGFRSFASRLLGRSVSESEVASWLHDQDVPTLFIEPVLERARPLIVHTPAFQRLIREKYNYHAELTTFAPNTSFAPEDLTPKAQEDARTSLGLLPGTFVIASFGFAAMQKAPNYCIIALDYLRSWGIPAELHLVGEAGSLEDPLRSVARRFGVEPFVRTFPRFVPEEQYRLYLLGADAAIQLRTYGFGQPSAALVDCISAGLPAVANESLAESCDAPSYVHAVPDCSSPLLLAEALARIWEDRKERHSRHILEERNEYCRRHSFDFYVERLKQILAL